PGVEAVQTAAKEEKSFEPNGALFTRKNTLVMLLVADDALAVREIVAPMSKAAESFGLVKTTLGGTGGKLVVANWGLAARKARRALTRPYTKEVLKPAGPRASAVFSRMETIWLLDKREFAEMARAATAATTGLANEVPRHGP